MRSPQHSPGIPAPDNRVACTAGGQSLSVLLFEDDRADALLVEELIADAAADITFAWAQSISAAERELARASEDFEIMRGAVDRLGTLIDRANQEEDSDAKVAEPVA